MAKRCGSRNKPCNRPRTNWWKQSLGVDWFNQGSSGGDTPVFSPTLQAVIDRAGVLGYITPPNETLLAIDAFLATVPISLLDTLRIKALNSTLLENFATLNYKNPSANQLVPTNFPVYTVRGWKGDALSAYLESNFNPVTNGVNYTQNSASRGMYVTVVATSGLPLDGLSGTTGNRMLAQSNTGQRINQGVASLNVAADFSGTGYRALDRPSSGVVNSFRGLVKTAHTATSAAMTSETQKIFRTSSAYSDVTIGLYFMGGSLSDADHNNIANGFATYLTAIGL